MPTNITTRRACMVAAAAAAMAMSMALPMQAGAQAAYPSKPIKIVVPYSPGTGADLIARLVSNDLASALGQPVIVENRVGAASAIGTAAVAKSAPDGHTLLMALNTHVITPASRKTPYHPLNDFAPIGQIANGQMLVLVNPSVPATTFPQFVDYLHKRRDEATYSSPGMGSTGHLYTLVLQDAIGSSMRHIPANGMTVALMDVMQNQSTMVIGAAESARANIASGKLKALAQMGKNPSPMFPDVPTLAQLGYPNIDLSIWIGLYAPAGTPRPIIDKLNKVMRSVVDTPAIRTTLADRGFEVALGSPEEFTAVNQREFALWTQVVQKHNVRAAD